MNQNTLHYSFSWNYDSFQQNILYNLMIFKVRDDIDHTKNLKKQNAKILWLNDFIKLISKINKKDIDIYASTEVIALTISESDLSDHHWIDSILVDIMTFTPYFYLPEYSENNPNDKTVDTPGINFKIPSILEKLAKQSNNKSLKLESIKDSDSFLEKVFKQIDIYKNIDISACRKYATKLENNFKETLMHNITTIAEANFAITISLFSFSYLAIPYLLLCYAANTSDLITDGNKRSMQDENGISNNLKLFEFIKTLVFAKFFLKNKEQEEYLNGIKENWNKDFIENENKIKEYEVQIGKKNLNKDDKKYYKKLKVSYSYFNKLIKMANKEAEVLLKDNIANQ